MPRLSPNDAMFLYGESPETMMHVGSLLTFAPPPGASDAFLRDILYEARASSKLAPPWNLKLKSTWLKNPMPAWVEATNPDLDYHLRRSALPSPGDERELGVLVSRLHATPIDFSRPPWETHLIEGLARGRFALYTKMHHSLIDGYTGNKMLAASFSTDPSERTPLFFNQVHDKPRGRTSGGTPWSAALDSLKTQVDAASEVFDSVRSATRRATADGASLAQSLLAPPSILNGRIGRSRRFATQQYELDRIKAIATATGGTVNDIVLALCGASLRRYLLDRGALPAQPLIAMLPVNVRPADDPGGGNQVGAIMVTLATDIEHPLDQVRAIVAATKAAKQRLQKLSRPAIIQLSALSMLPSGIQTLTGTMGRLRPQFNVVISNVPGPRQPLYFRGAELEAVYPLSIPVHGQAINITCTSYNGTLNFGFTGCRESLPHMQRIAVYSGEALAGLEDVLSTAGA